LTVALIQGGIESDVDWTESYNLIARTTYTAATERALADTHADIVIWPESSIGDIVTRNAKYSIPVSVQTLPRRVHAPLLFGAITNLGGRFFNSAVLVDESGEIGGISDKCVLIAFGEVLPFRRLVRFLPFPWGAVDIDRNDSLDLIEVPIGAETESTRRSARIATAICFDSVKPFVLREKVRRGAELIAIVTNNSWYKLPAGTEQHRMMDVFRAVENRRWALRVATTGVSHVVDPSGRIVAETKQFTPAHLIHSVQLLSGKTMYTRLGDWFGWICLAIGIVVFAWLIMLGNPPDFF
jgi:apolipoprotein N-acyltransferase